MDALLERALASENGGARLKHPRPNGDHLADPASEELRRRIEGALAEAQHCLSNGDFRRAAELAHGVLAIDEGNPMARLLVEEAADLRHVHPVRTPPRGIPVRTADVSDSAEPPAPARVDAPPAPGSR